MHDYIVTIRSTTGDESVYEVRAASPEDATARFRAPGFSVVAEQRRD